MKLNLGGLNFNVDTKKVGKRAKKLTKEISQVVEKMPVKAKRAAL